MVGWSGGACSIGLLRLAADEISDVLTRPRPPTKPTHTCTKAAQEASFRLSRCFINRSLFCKDEHATRAQASTPDQAPARLRSRRFLVRKTARSSTGRPRLGPNASPGTARYGAIERGRLARTSDSDMLVATMKRKAIWNRRGLAVRRAMRAAAKASLGQARLGGCWVSKGRGCWVSKGRGCWVSKGRGAGFRRRGGAGFLRRGGAGF